MVKISFLSAAGAFQEIEGREGESLMAAAVRNNVQGIEAACGGAMACGTCHVFVSEPWFSRLPSATEAEVAILECGLEVEPTSRLSCQIVIAPLLEGATIRTPESQL